MKIGEVVSFREDMLDILAKHGVSADDAFTFAEIVRKGKQVAMKEKFDGLIEKFKTFNVPDWFFESCRKIQYLFPKAHATAYMTASYICGWFKIYYPLEFYAAYFSYKLGSFDLGTLTSNKSTIGKALKEMSAVKELNPQDEDILMGLKVAQELYARGYSIKMISLTKSLATKFIVDHENKALIPPFTVIKSLGESIAESIVKARDEQEFKNIEDFRNRTKVNKTQFQMMVEYGIFNGMSESNQQSLFNL